MSSFRRLTQLWTSLTTSLIFALIFCMPQIALASATTLCCLCKIASTDAICITTKTIPSCGSLPTKSKNPLLQNYICVPVTDEQCTTQSQGKPGQCTNTPVDEATFAGTAAKAGQNIADAPHLNIPIPGLNFKSSVTAKGGYYQVPWLAQYISGVYRYLVGVSVVAAAIMITWGGSLYVLSGSVSDVKQAKKIIADAIVGLIFILGAYALLGTLNPSLVGLNTIKIRQVTVVGRSLETVNADIPPAPGEPNGDFMRTLGTTESETASLVTSSNADTSNASSDATTAGTTATNSTTQTTTPAATTACNPKDKIQYYAQGQAPWGSLPLGNKPVCTGDQIKKYGDDPAAPCCQAYGFSACGPTSLAMVLKSYGEDVDPSTIGAIAISAGLRNCNTGGVSPTGIITTGRFGDYTVDYSLDNSTDPNRPKKQAPKKKDMDGIDSALRSGKPIIFLCGGCQVSSPKNKNASKTKSFPGHFMVLTGVDDKGNYTVNDPSRAGYQTITKGQVAGPTVALYYVKRKDDTPVSSCK